MPVSGQLTRRAFLCLAGAMVAGGTIGSATATTKGATIMGRFHKVRDLTGRQHTGHLGVGGTDLGVMTTMPNGELLAVFGDTFDNDTVGGPGWRSPVGLIGRLDALGTIQWDRAAGPNPDRAEKFWDYHQGGPAFSTVLPSDVVTVGDTIYLHVMVNKGLGNVLWTEVWQSKDNARTWQHLYKVDGFEDSDEAQLWTWDYAPDENMVYAYTTKFSRDRGLRMRRIPADRMHDKQAWQKWGYHNNQWGWGGISSVILPGKFGEMTLRRMQDGTWVLTGFDAGNYRIDARVLSHPTANLHTAPRHTLIAGGGWGRESDTNGVMAQLYAGYVVPGSQVGVTDGFQIVASQWNTSSNWPYQSSQWRGTVPALPSLIEPVAPAPAEPKVNPLLAWLRSLLGH